MFNILSGNTDDHARNHAAFWDGRMLSLTPAYDICPQGRTGGEASQAMLINGNRRLSQLTICLEAAPQFLLSAEKAREIIDTQLAVIRARWSLRRAWRVLRSPKAVFRHGDSPSGWGDRAAIG
ncbi:hypothetical protein ASD79_02500 [Caulobacter sp. Root655]|nr:hypothetical protein ASD79_02500 [Caulobacter sp. Root655]